MALNTVDHVLEAGNPLVVAEALSAMEAFIKEVKADPRFTDYVRDEAKKYGKAFTSNSGAKIEPCETGTAYDFSKCNDFELPTLEIALMTAKDRVDKRKEFLKTVPSSGLLITDESTGETVTVYPPSKSSNSSFKITLAK